MHTHRHTPVVRFAISYKVTGGGREGGGGESKGFRECSDVYSYMSSSIFQASLQWQLIKEGLLTAQGTKYIYGIRRRLICVIRWAPLPTSIGYTFAASVADDTILCGGVHQLTNRITVELLFRFFFQLYGVDLNKTGVMTFIILCKVYHPANKQGEWMIFCTDKKYFFKYVNISAAVNKEREKKKKHSLF